MIARDFTKQFRRAYQVIAHHVKIGYTKIMGRSQVELQNDNSIDSNQTIPRIVTMNSNREVDFDDPAKQVMTFVEGTSLLSIDDFNQLGVNLDKLVNEVQILDEKFLKWTNQEEYLCSPNYKYGESYQGIQLLWKAFSTLERQFYYFISFDEYAQLKEIQNSIYPAEKVAIEHHAYLNVELTVKDMQTLKNGEWLNDQVVNGFIEMINKQCRNENTLVLKSYTYNLLNKQSEQKILRLARKANITNITMYILLPINPRNTHWSLMLVNRKDKKLVYYDSLYTSTQGPVFDSVKNIALVWDENFPVNDVDPLKSYTYEDGGSSKQFNQIDCGVFMLKNIQILSRSIEIKPSLICSQNLIDYDRIQIGVSLLKAKIGN